MKIKITYEYKIGNVYPYCVFTWIGGNCITESSQYSFSEAKEALLQRLQNKKEFVEIPQDEEVEI